MAYSEGIERRNEHNGDADMTNFNADTKTIEIKGAEYKVGYAKQRANGNWSLGVEGKRGATYMVEFFAATGDFSKLIRV